MTFMTGTQRLEVRGQVLHSRYSHKFNISARWLLGIHKGNSRGQWWVNGTSTRVVEEEKFALLFSSSVLIHETIIILALQNIFQPLDASFNTSSCEADAYLCIFDALHRTTPQKAGWPCSQEAVHRGGHQGGTYSLIFFFFSTVRLHFTQTKAKTESF